MGEHRACNAGVRGSTPLGSTKFSGVCHCVYANTKVQGDLAELQVLLLLKQAGYCVSIPFGENAPYDLVAEHPSGGIFRIQVRSSSWRQGVLTLSLRAVSKNYSRKLDLTRIDWFALWDGGRAYFIPVHAISTGAVFSLRRDAPRNHQVRRVRFSSAYEGLPE